MCRGVVEELNINDFLPVIAFEEEEEWEQDDRFSVHVGNGIYIRMDIDEYHDFLLQKEEEAFARFRKRGYPYDTELFQQLYSEGKLERNEEEDSSDEEKDSSNEEED